MQKVIIFLEKYVQWLALAIGALYVGWIFYGYVMTPPLKVTLGGKSYTPGEIDPGIVQSQIDPLNAEMNNMQPVTPPKIVDVLGVIRTEINGSTTKLADLRVSFPAPFVPGEVTPNPIAQPVLAGNVFNKLPIPPPATPGPFATGWTVALIPGPGAAAAALGAAAPAPQRQDTAYYVGWFHIDTAALANAFNNGFKGGPLPVNQLSTEFVTVDLLRQERGTNGTWGPATVIKSIPTNAIKPYPTEVAAKGPTKADWVIYRAWVQASQDLIIHPPFYPTAPDAQPVPIPPLDIAAAGAAGRTAAAPAPAPAAPDAGVQQFAPPGAGLFNPGLLIQPSIDLKVNDSTLEEGKAYRYAVRYRLYNPLFDNGGQASKQVADAFDMISSPDPAAIGADQKLWTGPVTVEARTHVYVTAIPASHSTADFAVYNWKNGKWTKTPVAKKAPGDSVGGATVVDIRRDSHAPEPYVLLMDDHGQITAHDVAKDSTDPDQQKYEALVNGTGQPGVAPTTPSVTPSPTPTTVAPKPPPRAPGRPGVPRPRSD